MMNSHGLNRFASVSFALLLLAACANQREPAQRMMNDIQAAVSAGELSAAELISLSKRLREIGNVQAAYLCGKRTVELVPENWEAWYDLGEIAQCVGKREEARAAYQLYFNHHPEDSEIEHLLIALKDEAPPPRASSIRPPSRPRHKR